MLKYSTSDIFIMEALGGKIVRRLTDIFWNKRGKNEYFESHFIVKKQGKVILFRWSLF